MSLSDEDLFGESDRETENLNNLFGSDSEEEKVETNPVIPAIPNEDVENEKDFDNKDENTQSIVIETSIPPTEPKGSNLFLLKLPNVLSIEPRPFNPTEFKEDDDHLLQNTIRWRHHSGTRESNSRLVRWSDGSFSLLVGDEFFDVATTNIADRYQYLTTQHSEDTTIKSQVKFKRFMSFKPSSTDSLAHKKLIMQMAQKHGRSQKTKHFITMRDPEQEAREAEKLEAQREKDRRKLENKRLQSARTLGDEGRYTRGDENLMRQLDDYEDEYDEDEDYDDDLVDEELLREVKRAAEREEPAQDSGRSKRLRIIEDSDDDD